MKNWKKMLVASLACTTLLGVSLPAADAAYSLSEEVKAPTAALLSATQIGVLKHETPSLQGLENKDAIVVMSFGTTFKDTREKTINATVKDIQAAHPGVKVVTAFTSHIIIDRIAENEGIKYPTPEEALEQLKAEGYTRVAITTLDVIPGMEYAYDVAVFQNYKDQFKKITCGTPLMYWQGQEGQADDVTETMKALVSELPKPAKDEAILLMAHGTPQISNAYYSVMQARLREMGCMNVYVYTVEGWPNLEKVMHSLKNRKTKIKKVTLVPLMMVAGDHATNDMAGSEPDSHKSILEAAGYKVNVYLHGIGENKAIRDLYVKRANDAWAALEAK